MKILLDECVPWLLRRIQASAVEILHVVGSIQSGEFRHMNIT